MRMLESVSCATSLACHIRVSGRCLDEAQAWTAMTAILGLQLVPR